MSMIEKAVERLKKPGQAFIVEKAAEKLTPENITGKAGASAPVAKTTGLPGLEENSTVEAAEIGGPKTESDRNPDSPAPKRTRQVADIDFGRLATMGMLTPRSRRSRIAEEFRIVKRPLLQKAFAKGPAAVKNAHLIMVTSARPGEGKTFTSINLAMSIASERDLTVLLVDADFSAPGVMRTLNLEQGKGLTNVLLEDGVGLADVLIRTNLPNLSLLPPGPPDPLTTELLASERMGRLIEEIAARYSDRVIIFDAPPIMASSEPGVLAMHVGQTVFVVEAEETGQATVREALGMISSCKNIGLVLNKTRSRLGTEQFGSYYGYGGS